MEERNIFNELASLDVGAHIEKKGRFSYLSWTYAVDLLKRKVPGAKWEVIRFNGLPYLETPVGYFVEVAVTIDDCTISQIHPVLDNNNKPLTKPNAFQINTSLQRCLVKAIAVSTGLGLYVYSGEDVPTDGEVTQTTKGEVTDYTPEQLEERRQFFLGKIEEQITRLGDTALEMISDFESKAKCKLTEMNDKVLKRVYTLLKDERVN